MLGSLKPKIKIDAINKTTKSIMHLFGSLLNLTACQTEFGKPQLYVTLLKVPKRHLSLIIKCPVN